MSRAFGQTIQPNGQRKALACISQNPANNNNNKQNVLAQKPNNNHHHQYGPNNFSSLKSQSFVTSLPKSVSTSILDDQENVCIKQQYLQQQQKQQQQTFKIYKDVQSPIVVEQSIQGKNQEELLQENIEAVKKELNNFLIDSLEKSICSDYQNVRDQCLQSFSDKENDQKNDVCSNTDNDVDDDDDIDMVVDDNDDLDNQKENCQSVLSLHSDISYVQHYPELDLLSDYSLNIWQYMLEKERQFMPNPFYMSKQQNINTKMRSILVDWLVDVADEYKLKDETLFLTINYIDRFLSKFSITRQEFQLLGTSALFIASKYEEIYPPELAEFVYITDDSFTKAQILVMEKTILNGLSFDVSVPTSNYFLDMFSTALVLDKQIYCLAKYLNLLTTLECTPFLKYYPSEIAICSIMLAGKILRISNIISDDFLQQSLSYEKQLANQGDPLQLLIERNNLLEALNQLRLYANKHPQQAIQKKYSEDKFYNASRIADEANI
ncbi:G2/mitotic-specific cyclin-A-like isoform X1 [Dermatophagoides farinae]|uniref:G2/mitotic-specific cyclin-A-like isoform X1 n=1 Tax=Dermatophagoides farinae TaxID=6954 RepID=UPI003F5E657D